MARRGPRALRGTPAAFPVRLLLALCSALACASYSDVLARGQRYYEDNQYDRALALWRDLDRRGAEFRGAERARYAYLRGMTDYRLGYRDDARHWLAIARAADGAHPGGLGSVWLERLDSALTDLGRASARSGEGAADVVQTIEAPPSAKSPGDPSRDAPSAAAAPSNTPPDDTAPGDLAPDVPVSGAAAPEKARGKAPAADAGATP